MIRRAYKYRFYPTPEQADLLSRTFGCVRYVYNKVLQYRMKAYYEEQVRVGYADASSFLTSLKHSGEADFLNEVSSVPLQQCLRHQQAAFKNFFEGRARYPKFKQKKQRQSAEFTRSAFKYREGKLYLAKQADPLDVRWSRKLPSEPTSITVSRDNAGRYFVSCLCECSDQKLPVIAKTVGLDMGLRDLVVGSDGLRVRNIAHSAKYAERLALAQKRLSRKKLGSKNRAKERAKVAKLHAKIADCRADLLHKTSRQIVNENQVICVETLGVRDMLKHPSYAKAISDAGWYELVRQLQYKSQWAGRQLVAIDRWHPSSKRCSVCGFVLQSLPASTRSWSCPGCASRHDRDLNAAVNIEAAGLAVLALGENVSDTGSVSASNSP